MDIVYVSAGGHTARYAAFLASATKMTAYDAKQYKGKKGTEVFFLGWVRAGKICGLKKALFKYTVCAIAGVGLSPASPQATQALKDKNSTGELPVFPLQGGFEPSKVGGLSRMLMNAIQGQLKQKDLADTITPEEKVTLKMLQEGADLVNQNNIAPLVSWYNRYTKKK